MCFSDSRTLHEFSAGNVKNKVYEWKTVTNNATVLDWISNGVKLPLKINHIDLCYQIPSWVLKKVSSFQRSYQGLSSVALLGDVILYLIVCHPFIVCIRKTEIIINCQP